MADLARVRHWANALIALHLDKSWTFAFDNARTRAGLCDYAKKRISVSRLLAGRYDDDEIHQVLLHEVAHALAGAGAGHGPSGRRSRVRSATRESGCTAGRSPTSSRLGSVTARPATSTFATVGRRGLSRAQSARGGSMCATRSTGRDVRRRRSLGP